uniref:TIL domain containing protein n=1 Tax=Rhipicephalus zambeziensis TaxID=60191 RepID=A0A224YFF6_9ACAR
MSVRLLVLVAVIVSWHSVSGQLKHVGSSPDKRPLIGKGGHQHHDKHRPKPQHKCTGKHEKVRQCVSGVCGDKICQDLWYRRPGCVSNCKYECVCGKGYYRDDRGVCILRLRCRKPSNFVKPPPPNLKFLH